GLIERRGTDWFAEVAPLEYQGFYEAVKAEMRGECVLPSTVGALTADDRRALKGAFRREWPPALRRPYEEFASAVSVASAARWKQALSTKPRKELAFWRLLRMGAAPYFLLGASDRERLRIRVATPWDWRQEFELVGFSVTPRAAGQPTVEWEARIRERASGQDRSVNGFVEVRWSHGRFMGAPEAKVQLVTAHSAVPGYFPLE
ncbi:MAG: hypothetical protein HYU28_01635, partial [Actinobacteria bacterium]|nr:hypothetical protein [Actinomycetota bacterium]